MLKMNSIDNNVSMSLYALQSAKIPNSQKMNMTSADQKEMIKTCKSFEALMVKQMFESMQSSQKMFGSGFGGDYFQGMFQDEVAKMVSEEGQGIGIAKMLYQQLNRSNTVK
jgi:peptidoglycan hydrolase FlgJ